MKNKTNFEPKFEREIEILTMKEQFPNDKAIFELNILIPIIPKK